MLLCKVWALCNDNNANDPCLASDQVRQRQFVHTDPASGVATPTLPFRIAGAASHAPGKPAPRLGEDTAEIMAWLEGGS